MAGFVYFLPDGEEPPKVLTDRNLTRHRDVMAGPDRRPGKVFANDLVGEQFVGYWNDRQNWETVPGSSVWIGYNRLNPPTPKDLERKKVLPGYVLTLGDGQEWRVPTARTYDEDGTYRSLFPKVIRLNNQGEVLTSDDISSAYLPAWELAEKVHDEWMAPSVDKREGELKYSRVFEILTINYDIGFEEISCLGIVTSENATLIAGCFLDSHNHPLFKKKNQEKQEA